MTKNANTKTLTDSDTVQTWTTKEITPAGWDWGRIVRTETQRLDWNARTIISAGSRTEDGETLRWSDSVTIIPDEATPERAAEWRRRNGFVRIG